MIERPTILLLGCFHQAQLQEVAGCYWNKHRAAFAQVLETLLEEYEVRSIGEEAQQDTITSAAAIAKIRGIPYANVDIPLCIQGGIKVHPREGLDGATGRYTVFEGTNKYRVAWDNVREYHMHETFVEFQKGRTPSLLICGIAHQDGFSALLSPRFEVVRKSYDCPGSGPQATQ